MGGEAVTNPTSPPPSYRRTPVSTARTDPPARTHPVHHPTTPSQSPRTLPPRRVTPSPRPGGQLDTSDAPSIEWMAGSRPAMTAARLRPVQVHPHHRTTPSWFDKLTTKATAKPRHARLGVLHGEPACSRESGGTAKIGHSASPTHRVIPAQAGIQPRRPHPVRQVADISGWTPASAGVTR